LIQGAWDSLDEVETDQRLLVVDSPAMIRRQAVPLGPGARPALIILAAMVVLLATGVVAPVTAALLAAIAMVLSRVLTVTQAYRAISWTTVILVGAMIPVSVAVSQSGAADLIAENLVDLVGDAGPYALLIGLFVITAVFGQLISNTATALIMIPIALTAAADLGVSVRPVMMSLTVAAAAAFLTPVATPDYWKLGLPMLLLFMAASVFMVPVFWPF
jgi:di/tricarboxylate transporter